MAKDSWSKDVEKTERVLKANLEELGHIVAKLQKLKETKELVAGELMSGLNAEVTAITSRFNCMMDEFLR